MVESPVLPLHVRVAATAGNVGRLRRDTRRWLGEVVADPDAVEDLTLAVSEAVENAVDHAFAGGARSGTISVCAEYRADGGEPATVVLTILDDGRWLPVADPGYRGRGLGLIAACCSSSDIDTGDCGTRVTLTYRL